MNIMFPGTT